MNQISNTQELEPEIQCPSFKIYSSTNTLSIAESNHNSQQTPAATDDDFFAFPSPATVSDDTHQVFPLFNRNLLNTITNPNEAASLRSDILVDYRDRNDDVEFVGSQIENLFLEEDRDSSSSSESETEELERSPEGTYCVWPSPSPSPSPSLSPSPSPSLSPSGGRCEKSNSTGTSASGSVMKKWRLRDLLRRSKSDGKESLGFVEKKKKKKNENNKKSKVNVSSSSSSSATEMFHVNSRAMKGSEKRKSYLPYRPELLVGFFGSNASVSHGRRAMPRFG